MGYQIVTWPMTSRDPRRCCEAVRSAILATAWLLVTWRAQARQAPRASGGYHASAASGRGQLPRTIVGYQSESDVNSTWSSYPSRGNTSFLPRSTVVAVVYSIIWHRIWQLSDLCSVSQDCDDFKELECNETLETKIMDIVTTDPLTPCWFECRHIW